MNQSIRAWPVLLLLLTTVLVPTVCLLWFMIQAIHNERLVVREKLIEVYRKQLATIPPALEKYWNNYAETLQNVSPQANPGQRFADIVTNRVCDAVLILDSSGNLLYPYISNKETTLDSEETSSSADAVRAEYGKSDPLSAAFLYAIIAKETENTTLAARALQAQARCYVKAGEVKLAINVLANELSKNEYGSALDSHGRLIYADALLYSLQLIRDKSLDTGKAITTALENILTDYIQHDMPSTQRRFIMQQLISLTSVEFPTLKAENLAGDFVDSMSPEYGISLLLSASITNFPKTSKNKQLVTRIRPTHLQNIWSIASPDLTTVALFRQQTILKAIETVIADRFDSADVKVKLIAPSEPLGIDSPLLTIQAGESMPGWRLALHLEGNSPLASAAAQRISYYLWMGITVVVVIAALSLLVTRMVTRQMKLTRLKNDLIATVSHELKTPLASMRALVETLLEGRCRNEQQKTEYLELVARENLRLSRLIDNFLTFSRMERNKRTFDLVNVRPADVARSAVDSVRERFESAGCAFEVEIADDLPVIVGDQDALVTVLLNLLDNACKYSEDEKHIRLRVFANGRNVSFEVSDRGIGMPRRVVRRIFDRFYQADRKLSRKTGGCGLGLSITRFLVDVHGGRIEVASRPGEGSTFTVVFPAVDGNN